jgi:hypothetical protein
LSRRVYQCKKIPVHRYLSGLLENEDKLMGRVVGLNKIEFTSISDGVSD